MPRAEIPEGAWRRFNAMRWGDTNDGEMATEREALEAIASDLHTHWLEQLKEELRKKGVEAILREREDRHISPPERGSEEWSCWVAEAEEDLEAALDSIPIEEAECLQAKRGERG